MSHGWTHRICRACYASEEPGRDPVRVLDEPPGRCCFCGAEQPEGEGIFYRADPRRAQFCIE